VGFTQHAAFERAKTVHALDGVVTVIVREIEDGDVKGLETLFQIDVSSHAFY
jgi:hypothetical protein